MTIKSILGILLFTILFVAFGCVNSDAEDMKKYDNVTFGLIKKCASMPANENRYDYSKVRNIHDINLAEDRDDCYFKLAYAKSSPDICNKITDSSYLGICFDELALKAQDPTICFYASGNFNTWCVVNIAISKNDSAVCDVLKGMGGSGQSVSAGGVTVASHGSGTVSNIDTRESYGLSVDCKITVARHSMNISICNELSAGYDSCIYAIADDTATCAMIKTSSVARDNCYDKVAIDRINESICDLIDDAPTMGNCYGHVAQVANNTSICDRMDSYYVQTCIYNVEAYQRDVANNR